MEQKVIEDIVSSPSYNTHSKKSKRKRKVKFRHDFSTLLRKMYVQNASNPRFCQMGKNQLKVLNYKREVTEYEEDISNRLKRIKLEDANDGSDFLADVIPHTNMASSKLADYQKISKCSGDPYITNVEIKEEILEREISENMLSKSYINCLTESMTQTQLFSQNFDVKQVEMNTHGKMYNEMKTNFSLSHSAYLDNKVYFSEAVNAAFSAKSHKEYFDDVQSPMNYSRYYNNTDASNFDDVYEDTRAISSLVVEKTLISKNMHSEMSKTCEKLSLLDQNLKFTGYNVQHSHVLSHASDTSADNESIFSAALDNLETECPNGQYIESEKEVKTEKKTNNIDSLSECLDHASQIKNTIISLFMLEIKIKQCKEVLKKFGITSDSYDGFKKLKLKSAKLIKTYKILMNKRKREKMRIEKSKKRACSKKHNVVLENKPILNYEFSSELCIQEEGKDYAKENEIENISPFKTQHQSKEKKKRDDEMQIPGRSKILDECIMRLNSSKIYSRKNTKESDCFKKKNVSQIWNSKGSPETKDSVKSELYLTGEKMPENKQALEDPFDQEIDKILSQLPSLGNISNTVELSDQENMNIGLKEPPDYGSVNSKSFVLYPYVTA